MEHAKYCNGMFEKTHEPSKKRRLDEKQKTLDQFYQSPTKKPKIVEEIDVFKDDMQAAMTICPVCSQLVEHDVMDAHVEACRQMQDENALVVNEQHVMEHDDDALFEKNRNRIIAQSKADAIADEKKVPDAPKLQAPVPVRKYV